MENSEPKFKIGDEVYFSTTDDFGCVIVKKIKIKSISAFYSSDIRNFAYLYDDRITWDTIAKEWNIFSKRDDAIEHAIGLLELQLKDKIEYLKRESDK